MKKTLLDYLMGLLGACLGGFVGYWAVFWISQQRFYAPVLPGALAGLGCGILSRTNSNGRGVLAAVVGLIASVISEWLIFYRPAEISFAKLAEFIKQYPNQPMITLVLTGLGVFLGFWWGRECTIRSRLRGSDRPRAPQS